MILTATGETQDRHVTITVELSDGLTDDAIARIHGVMRREAERFSQIAAVDLRDQKTAESERKRLAAVPKNRPSIIVGAGTKSADAVLVERGSFKVGNRTVKAAGER